MRKQYTAKQKALIVMELLREEKTIAQISSEYGVYANQPYR
jgi:transposase-like protein